MEIDEIKVLRTIYLYIKHLPVKRTLECRLQGLKNEICSSESGF